MKWKTIIAVVLPAMLIAALLWPAERGRNGAPERAIVALAMGDHVLAAGGLVEPASQARVLGATVIGRIVAVNVEEGDSVAKGDVIAEIENDDLKAQLGQAQATLDLRESELLRLTTGARPEEIAAARAELREAEAAAAIALSNFQRRATLGAKQIVSQEAVEQARAERDTTAAHRDVLNQRLALLIAPPRAEDAAIARANVAAAKARVSEIGAEIEKTLVRSPVDGVVLKLHRRAGETVSSLPPTDIATVGDTSNLRVRADVDQADVGKIALGQTVWVTSDAFAGKRYSGTVAEIGRQLGRKNFRSGRPEERVDTNILEVLIDLEPDSGLPVGLPVDVTVDALGTKFTDASNAGARAGAVTQFKQSIDR